MAARDIITQVTDFLHRFVAYPSSDALLAHALWILHTHLMEHWESTPRIAFLSPEPGSGKTRALEVTELLVPNPVEAINVTAAYLFRKVADTNRPTILFDEADTYFGSKAKNEHEEIRGLLNAGHRRGAMVGRVVAKGRSFAVEETPCYGAVAIAGLGDLPNTILSRSIVINMRRRAPDEQVEPFRLREHRALGLKLRTRITKWAVENGPNLTWPELPPQVVDRNADVWEPLVAIADLLGGDWPERARSTAVAMITAGAMERESLGLRLLADIRLVFNGHRVLATGQLTGALINMDEAPWGDLFGRPLDARGLARRLQPYGVKSKTVRIGDSTAKGYVSDDFADAWARYLGPAGELGPSPVDFDDESVVEQTELLTEELGATEEPPDPDEPPAPF